MNVKINNKEMSDDVCPSENNDVSDNRIFDDSKLAKLDGVKTRGLNPYPYKFEKINDIPDILKKFEDFEKK